MTVHLIRPLLPLAALLILAACHGSKPAGGGTVTMHDMQVVDGTANDAMVDLDNATQDGTPLSNAGGLPGAVPMGPAVTHAPLAQPADNGAATEPGATANGSTPQ